MLICIFGTRKCLRAEPLVLLGKYFLYGYTLPALANKKKDLLNVNRIYKKKNIFMHV